MKDRIADLAHEAQSWSDENEAMVGAVAWLGERARADHCVLKNLRTNDGPRLDCIAVYPAGQRLKSEPLKKGSYEHEVLVTGHTLRWPTPPWMPAGSQPELLAGAVTGVASVLRTTQGRPTAILAIFRNQPPVFDDTDAVFLESTAALLSASLNRMAAEHEARAWHDAQQRRLNRKIRQAERLSAVATFAAGIAHEVNSPLNAILLNAQLLERALVDSPHHKRAQTLVKDTRRCIEVVESVVKLSRKGESAKSREELDSVVADGVEFAHEHCGTEVKLNLALDAKGAMANMNPASWKQVIRNLVSNAKKAVGDGAEVSIATSVYNDLGIVSVCDNGPGISRELRDRVFDPFFSAEERTGTGLGLALVDAIVQDHGGSIRVDDNPGGGACFTIEIPLLTEPQTERSAGDEGDS